MVQAMLGARGLIAMLIALATGAWGLHAYPVQTDNVFLALIALKKPVVFHVLTYGYATLWFTTAIPRGIARDIRLRDRRLSLPRDGAAGARCLRIPNRSRGRRRRSCSASGILRARRAPRPDPTWLTIPQRGLYTGVMILGAVGTGKTSACMYPYVDQLLRWRADDPAQKARRARPGSEGRLLPARCVRCCAPTDRETDYLEIGLDTGVCYNPLHNDLDPYAVAYAIARLLNNLFGKSKEPFWQQAYTDLLKFVISLRRITDGYTTLSEVYRYIIEDALIEQEHPTPESAVRQPAGRPRRSAATSTSEQLRQAPWTLWVPLDETHVGTSVRCRARGATSPGMASRSTFARVAPRSARTVGTASRRFKRWFYNTLDAARSEGSRPSIVEGVVVFLSLFDDNPAVHRAFCPPRDAYIRPPKPGEPPSAAAARRSARERARARR